LQFEQHLAKMVGQCAVGASRLGDECVAHGADPPAQRAAGSRIARQFGVVGRKHQEGMKFW
jgi:hypothetical protein